MSVKTFDELIFESLKSIMCYQTQALFKVVAGDLGEYLDLDLLESVNFEGANEVIVRHCYVLIMKTYFKFRVSSKVKVLLRIFLDVYNKYEIFRVSLAQKIIEYLKYRLEFGKVNKEKLKIIVGIKRLKENLVNVSELSLCAVNILEQLVQNEIISKNIVSPCNAIEKFTGFQVLVSLFEIYLPGFDFCGSINKIFLQYRKELKIILTSHSNKRGFSNALTFLSVFSNHLMMLSKENKSIISKLNSKAYLASLKLTKSNCIPSFNLYNKEKNSKMRISNFEELFLNVKKKINSLNELELETIYSDIRLNMTLAKKKGDPDGLLYKIFTFNQNSNNFQHVYNEIHAYEITGPLADNENCFINYSGCFFTHNSVAIIFENSGFSFRDYITGNQNQNFTENFILNTIKKLLESFQILKENKIFHCDIKTGNLTFNREMEPKIIDYGSCVLLENTKKKQKDKFHPLGTRGYCSPLLFQALKGFKDNGNNTKIRYDLEKNDVFSLGMVFLEITIKESCSGLNNPLRRAELESKIESIPYPKLKEIIKPMLKLDHKERPSFIDILTNLN